MPDKEILQFGHASLENGLDQLVAKRVEEPIDAMPEAEADEPATTSGALRWGPAA